MKTKTMRERLLATSMICGAAFVALSATAAQAQETDVSEIVVTGSRIARQNFESPTPVTVIDSRAIEATGAINTGDIIRTLPAAGVSAVTPTNSGFNTTGNGITTVDLRNLGEDRTLVLLNGRRFVGGVVGTQQVDFNTIPTEIIDRVDVVTGGASAVYGSDALAGVVNIITKKNFQGLILSGQYGLSQRNDDERSRISLTAGSRFLDDKGSAMISLSYSRTGAIFARNRDDQGMAIDALDDYDGDPANYGLIHSQTTGLFSSFTEFGTIEVPRNNAASLLRVVQTDGSLVPYSSAAFGFNRQGVRLLQTPLKQLSFFGQFDYEITPQVRLFSEVSYVRSKVSSTNEPTPLGSDDVYGALTFCDLTGCANGIPITSPLVPASVAAAAQAANPTLAPGQIQVGFRRRLTEVGDRGNDIDRSTFRIVSGITGDIGENHHYEVSLNYGRTDDDQFSGGDVNILRFAQALDATVVNGQVVCADAAARAAGCVPLNIFGKGSISPAAADFVRAPTSRDSMSEQLVAGAYLHGETISLPAGPLGYAVGAEFRRETSRDTPDGLTLSGLTSSNATPETKGKFEVREAFGELRIPILRDMAFVKSLDLNLAARFSDYTTVGSTSAYAASLEYLPNDWLKLRAQYSKAVRAPNVNELFQPASQDFPSVNDPCAGVTRSGGAPAFFNLRTDINNPANVFASGIDPATVGNAVAVACLADPAVLARVNRDGGLSITQPEQQSVTGFDGGNATLKAEKGTTWTLGFLINPPGDRWWSKISLSVDYYMIKIDDRIDTIDEDRLLTGCYSASGFNPASSFCSAIGRFPNGPQVGALNFVNQVNDNFAESDARGYDVQISYTQDLNDLTFLDGIYSGERGRLTGNLTYGYLEKLRTIPFKGATSAEYIYDAGTVGAPTNEWTLDLAYRRGPLQVTWNTQYIGEVVITKDANDFYYNVPLDAAVFHNAQVRYQVNDKVTTYFGVDNLTDEYMFVGGTNGLIPGQTTGWTTFPDVYDGIGRRYYAGVKVNF